MGFSVLTVIFILQIEKHRQNFPSVGMTTNVTVTDYMIGYLEGGIRDDTCAFLKGSETSSVLTRALSWNTSSFWSAFPVMSIAALAVHVH